MQNSRKIASHFMVTVMQPDDIPVIKFHKVFNDWQDSQFTMFSSHNRSQRLFNFKVMRCSAYWVTTLISKFQELCIQNFKTFHCLFPNNNNHCMIHSLIYVCIFFQMHFNLVTIKLLSDFLEVRRLLERGAIFIWV